MALTKKGRRVDSMVQVPIASMIDVVFLLLIYFILTQKEEIAEAHLAVNLPTPGAPPPDQKEPPKVIEIDIHAGQAYLQKVPRSPERIREILTELGKLDPNQTVMIRTKLNAKSGELVQILDICAGAGLTKLNLLSLL